MSDNMSKKLNEELKTEINEEKMIKEFLFLLEDIKQDHKLDSIKSAWNLLCYAWEQRSWKQKWKQMIRS